MEDVLYNAACSFSNVMKYDYIYTLGRKKKLKISVLSNKDHLFTHIFGLDHLCDVPKITTDREWQKRVVYKKILKKEITFSDIEHSSDFNKPIPNTKNTATGSNYTIKERLIKLQNLEYILDHSFNGRMYKWDRQKSTTGVANGGRYSDILADFLLVVPSEENADEKIYLFMYQSNKENKSEEIELRLHSAFADCVDLTIGQEAPYTILKLVKREIKTKTEDTLFTYPSYSNAEELVPV